MSELFLGEQAIELRPYQLEAVDRARKLIRDGARNILLCMPTGSGKTVVASHLIHESYGKGRRSAFVADRITLIGQTSDTLLKYGIDHGVIQADHPRAKPWHRVQVCSDATLRSRGWPDADLIIVDEAHTVTKTVADRIGRRDSITLGLTATPFTKGLGKLYDGVINVTTTNQLIAAGFLSPFRIFSCVEPDMEGVRVVAGEWEEKETAKRALQVVGDVVTEYLKNGEGRRFIASSVDVAHAEELARQFNQAGIRALAYSYKTPDEERKDMVADFARPDSYIRGLISPVALTKGYDNPLVSCVIMARPLRRSLAEHIQFFGRGLRIHPAKRDCIVLDHSGNCARFWDEWQTFFAEGCLELNDGEKKEKPKKKDSEEPSMIKCPQCRALHQAMPRCPICGFERPKLSMVQHVPGTLKELLATGDRKMVSANVWPQIVAYVTSRFPTDLVHAERVAYAKYKDLTGLRPTTSFVGVTPEPPTPELLRRIRAMDIRRAKARDAARRAA